MTLTEESRDEVVVLGVEGRLDANSFDAFNQRIEALKVDRVVVDLEKLEYISSAGLRALLSSLRRLEGKNGALALARASAFVREIIEVAGLDSVLELHQSVDEAVAAVRPR